MIKLNLKLEATDCNGWPNLIIEFNNKKILEKIIEKESTLEVELDNVLKSNNQLIIGMNNKSFGRKGIWDTKTEDNKIIKDKTLIITSCKLNDVETKDLLIKNKFRVRLVDKQPSYYPTIIPSQGIMNYNGYFFINFSLPLYNNLTNQKFKRQIDHDKSYFSNYTKVFHYDEEQKIISELESILNNINEKSSNNRTKIRDSQTSN
jgi:hypothetical protein|tara:strand:+ start:60 stop:674 length:615 start_codon:yes stop_codon:yes gene_type:complete